MSYADSYDAEQGIAIVALAGRFPGARDVEEFWQNVLAGRETIARFAEDELEPSNPFDMEHRRDPDYVRARGILEDVDLFDADFFRMSPREADVTDPQQRVFLETAWEALERAGYDPETYDGAIGVYAGMSNNTYFLANLYHRPDILEQSGELPMLGNEKDYLATRVSYKLDLRGPSINVVTACSSSLVAVCQAVQALETHQCDMALAGGVSIGLPQKRGYLYREGFITSPDGHCRAFDEHAAGTVFSNGLGIVVLKRLEDALADGDDVVAVIKGVGLTNDGSGRVSFTAPSVDGQADAIAMAQAIAGIDPDTIGYVEAHGTGTALGDPIEVAGLTQAFRLVTDETGYCALGSVKTNIGHLDAAAGVTGLIKAALVVRHGIVPPTLHFESPNAKLDLPATPFFVTSESSAWPLEGVPRRAGVSSLGAGGTNAHAVLEEAPALAPPAEARAEQLLLLSARSATALDEIAARLQKRLEGDPDVSLADVAYTLQVGRRRFEHRRAFVATSRDEAIELLSSGDAKRVVSDVQDTAGSRIVFLFPGQGAQRVNMGRDLYESEPVYRAEIDACSELLRPLLDRDIREILYPSDDRAAAAESELSETAITQPALFATSYALTRLWEQWGVTPDAMMGHSLGEYVAASLASVFSRDDALTLVARRALLMQEVPHGSMLAVRATVDDVSPLLTPSLSIAGLNAPNLTVVSGPSDAVSALAEELHGRGVASRELVTSHAFHSEMMDPVVDRFAAVVAELPRQAPVIPFVSSLTGNWITAEEATDPGYWARQLREPVRFADGVGRLLEDPANVYVEVGPGRTLTTLLRQHPDGSSARAAVVSMANEAAESTDISSMLMAGGRLWIAGASLDWAGVHGGGRRRRVQLPTYPFERKRHWVEPAPGASRADVLPGVATNGVTLSPPTLVAEEPMTEPIIAQPAQQSQQPDVTARVRRLFAELSGLEESDFAASASFLDLGLDSLFLTQASTTIQKTFGVRVPFRVLLEEATTIEAVSATIAEQLPPEAVAPAQPAPSPVALPPELGLQPGVAGGETLVEQVIAQQMEIMSRQLELLRGSGAMSSVPAPQAPPAPIAPPPSAPKAAAAEGGTIAFGPYRPPARGEAGGLTDRQAAAVEALVERYVAKTASSKRFTDENRAHLADPRSVAGFRSYWKEMVYPIVTTRSAGSKLWDLDGNEYVDLTNGFGIILFGHNPPFIREAIEAQLREGYETGPQTILAGEVAKTVSELTGMERVAFCNTGSEAVTAAIRVARTVSGRDRIVMFTGAYHGIFDEVLVRPTRVGGELRAVPIAPGIPQNMVDNIVVLDYDSPESLEVLRAHGSEFAAVLVEPVQSRRPELVPVEFLREVRAITEKTDTALVFDEVVSGFRVHQGGAQALFGIRADLTTYGKVVGGGLPIGLVAGSPMYMDALDGGSWSYGDDSAPEVGVTFFAGTFVRHPLALAAARAVLGHLQEEGPDLQRTLNVRTSALVDELNAEADALGAPVRVTSFASWFCFNFPPDVPHATTFYAYLREKGIHVWEGRAGFLTTAHTDEDLTRVVQAFRETLVEMQAGDLLPGPGEPPVAGARRGEDANGNAAWFVTDPDRPGRYLQVGDELAGSGD